ncbi:hypothetical protein RVW94_005281 [Pseudomonas aeruginosa]|nr:hypothetical protein [Pseudomonas aeruginosa]
MSELYKIGFWVCAILMVVMTGLLFLVIATHGGEKELFDYLDHIGSFIGGIGGVATAGVALAGVSLWRKQLVHGKQLEVIWEGQVALREVHMALQYNAFLLAIPLHNKDEDWYAAEMEKNQIALNMANARFRTACTFLDKLVTNNGWEWVNESSQLNSVWVSHKSLLEKQAKVGGKVSPASIEESSVSWQRVEQNIKRIEKHLDALRDEYS